MLLRLIDGNEVSAKDSGLIKTILYLLVASQCNKKVLIVIKINQSPEQSHNFFYHNMY